MLKIDNNWFSILNEEIKKEYFQKIKKTLENEYKNYQVFPPKREIFRAFEMTDFDNIKVVILGQDPYHGKMQANGLAFSVNNGIKIPPSLLNIYKELKNELNLYIPNNGNLSKWAEQGVFLLNTTLTVRESQPNSHSEIGWSIFTDNIIKKISDEKENVVFLLWGNNAKSKEKLIDTSKHIIFSSVHPSPLSANRGFFGCNHFIETNKILKKLGKSEIDWQIENIGE